MQKISKVLETLIERNKKFERLKVFPIVTAWKEIVGEKIAVKAQIHDFRNGELVIICSDPMWRMEIELRKDVLVEKMNRYIGKDVVKRIKIRRDYYGR
ncbi:MAG: DUF721 domain-containing protein [Thermotogaceae bacterium]|nr:DUF721 domain-containing protein [Thermotogaceae bacterium]